MTSEELKEIEARASSADIPRIAAELRKMQTLVRLSEEIEDARIEHEIADELRLKKFGVFRKAEKAFSEALREVTGRPVVKTERELELEALERERDALLRKLGSKADDENKK